MASFENSSQQSSDKELMATDSRPPHETSDILRKTKRIDRDFSDEAVWQSGLMLLISLGVVAPVFLFLILQVTGLDALGPVPTLFIVSIVGVSYVIYILSSRRVTAGLVAALPVLLFFAISFPLSPEIQERQVRFILASCAAVPLSILVIYRSEFRVESLTGRVTFLLFLFSGVTILSGLVNVAKGNPATGIIFGFGTLNMAVVSLAISGGLTRINSRPLIDLIIYSALLQIAWATFMSSFGSPIGLPYLGDSMLETSFVGSITIINFQFPLGPFTAGRFAGGFAGNARILMSLLIIISPLAIYNYYDTKSGSIKPLFILLGTLFMVVVAHSDGGLGAILIGGGLAMYVNSRFYIKNFGIRSIYAMILGAVILGSIVLWFVLNTGWVGGSDPRVVQFTTSIDAWANNPVFGIGGYNASTFYDFSIHSFFFAFGAELGTIALSIYLFTMVLVTVYLLKSYFKGEVATRKFAGTIIAIILSFHFYISVSTVYRSWQVMSLFWFVMILGLHSIFREDFELTK